MGKIARSVGGCCLPFVGFIFYHHSDNSLMNDLSNRFVILSLSLFLRLEYVAPNADSGGHSGETQEPALWSLFNPNRLS